MKKVLVSAILGELAKGASAILAERGYEAICLDEVTPEDIDCGLAHIDNDVCFPTIAAVGQYIRYLSEHNEKDATCVLAAEICRDCRSVSAPSVLSSAFRRAGLSDIEIVSFSSAESRSAAASESSVEIAPSRPVIGLCGNVPALTTREVHRAISSHLAKCGCQVLVPPLQRIIDERDFLTPALEFFHEHGVKNVICIVPFGCLGGHVYARGQLRKMQGLFPEIELTILDYDPSASEINLINRAELVVQRALERMQTPPI